MSSKYYFLILLFFIVFTACKEETIFNTVVPSISITEPISNFVAKEYDSVSIQIETVADESSIECVELYSWSTDFFEDTLIYTFTQKPFKKYLIIPKICVENTFMFLKSCLKLKTGKKVSSEIVWGIVLKDMPPDDEMNIYDYKGFDNDSNLVCEGIISFYIKDDSEILGRKKINSIIPDSAFEAGVGFIEGIKSHTLYNNYFIKMNVCYFISAVGYLFIDLKGSLDGNRLYGDRYLSSFDPTTVKVGTFTAVKRD